MPQVNSQVIFCGIIKEKIFLNYTNRILCDTNNIKTNNLQQKLKQTQKLLDSIERWEKINERRRELAINAFVNISDKRRKTKIIPKKVFFMEQSSKTNKYSQIFIASQIHKDLVHA